MENKNYTDDVYQEDRFVKRCKTVLIVSGIAVAGIIGYRHGFKDGYKKGFRKGTNKILDRIVESSTHRGIVMQNPDLGKYVFTASKLG